jgi:protein translocase SecG subunit
MTFLIVLITVVLILDCLLLGLLILIQLPKKEAGVGVAFGGGATDALFGAGSGTALSNLTKYTATAFFILVIILSMLNAHARHGPSKAIGQASRAALDPAQHSRECPGQYNSAHRIQTGDSADHFHE